MKPLIATIPDDVLRLIQGKMVIEAGVATGPSFMVFAGNTFNPPVELEKGLEWIEQALPIPTFKGASIKFDDFTVLWFRFNEFSRYQTEPAHAPLRPEIRISGHKVEPMRINQLRGPTE